MRRNLIFIVQVIKLLRKWHSLSCLDQGRKVPQGVQQFWRQRCSQRDYDDLKTKSNLDENQVHLQIRRVWWRAELLDLHRHAAALASAAKFLEQRPKVYFSWRFSDHNLQANQKYECIQRNQGFSKRHRNRHKIGRLSEAFQAVRFPWRNPWD